jgi:hypothetical protein
VTLRRVLLLLGGVLALAAVPIVHTATRLWKDWRHRAAYVRVKADTRVEDLDAVFGRSEDCVFLVDDNEVRYYLSPAFHRVIRGCGGRAVRTRREWGQLPQSTYAAAVVVIAPSGRVLAKELTGEGGLTTLGDAPAPPEWPRMIGCCNPQDGSTER